MKTGVIRGQKLEGPVDHNDVGVFGSQGDPNAPLLVAVEVIISSINRQAESLFEGRAQFLVKVRPLGLRELPGSLSIRERGEEEGLHGVDPLPGS